ncbi:hypothetical protein KC640_03595, partial [Candidatus Dojkabacteria bacterium]|nr:hypothetical protein [Candidatus Dojkabacteria bacterium]
MDERLPSIKEKLQRQISELGQLIASGVRPDEEARKSLEHSIFRDFLSAQQDEGMSEDDLAAILDQYTALRPDDSFLVKDASEFDAAAFFGLMSFAEGMYKTGYLFAITYLRKAADVCGEVLGACRASEENMAKINKALAVNARLIETISGGDWDSIPGRFLRTIKAFEFYTGLENGIDNIA